MQLASRRWLRCHSLDDIDCVLGKMSDTNTNLSAPHLEMKKREGAGDGGVAGSPNWVALPIP